MINMTLATVAELALHTGWRDGSGDAGGILAQILADVELEIGAELSRYSLSMPSSSNTLKPAVIKLCKVEVLRREYLEKSRPAGLHSIEYMANPQIEAMKQEAWDIVNSYIRVNSSSGQYRYYIRKAN